MFGIGNTAKFRDKTASMDWQLFDIYEEMELINYGNRKSAICVHN